MARQLLGIASFAFIGGCAIWSDARPVAKVHVAIPPSLRRYYVLLIRPRLMNSWRREFEKGDSRRDQRLEDQQMYH